MGPSVGGGALNIPGVGKKFLDQSCRLSQKLYEIGAKVTTDH